MFDGKLYSVWIDGEPSPVLSVYHDDGEAISSFRSLILSVRDDIRKGLIEAGTDIKMSLYVHGRFYRDGSLLGFKKPVPILSGIEVHPESDEECILSGIDVQPESDGECEVIE